VFPLSKGLSAVLLTLLAIIATATTALAVEAESENPLEPLDASSPRATLQSFVEQTSVVEDAALKYRVDRSLETQGEYLLAVAKTAELSDLSEAPAASQDTIVEGNFAALADILMRIPLPDAESIPDAEQVAADELTQWTLPGTEITLKPLEEGDRAGSWVLTPRTVAGLAGWREEVEGLPVLVEDVAITNWQRTMDFSTGPLIPGGLISSLPDVAQTRVLGSPLWKSLVALVGAMLVVLIGVLWYRFIGRRGPKDSIRRQIFGITTPVVVLLSMSIYERFMASQVGYSGELAEFVALGTTIALWLTLAWLFKELVELVVEWVIVTPFISGDRYDAHLLRLISRVISAVGALIIVLIGAEQIGIPALGLLATASVGGLVIGLAAQSTIENLIGGMTLFADKPFEVGDSVGFGEDNGTVEEIGPRSTRIRKLDGTQLTVPNSDIVQARISNFTQRNNALFLHTIGVRYETTLEQIERLVARIGAGLRANPKVEQDDDMPRVRLAAFGGSSIDIEARAYVATTNVHQFMAVQEELLSMIMREVEAAGTSMAFPSTTAYLTRDEGIAGPGVLDQRPDPRAPGPAPEGTTSRSDPKWEEDDADTGGSDALEGQDDD
jgi:MscS family membrane protein